MGREISDTSLAQQLEAFESTLEEEEDKKDFDEIVAQLFAVLSQVDKQKRPTFEQQIIHILQGPDEDTIRLIDDKVWCIEGYLQAPALFSNLKFPFLEQATSEPLDTGGWKRMLPDGTVYECYPRQSNENEYDEVAIFHSWKDSTAKIVVESPYSRSTKKELQELIRVAHKAFKALVGIPKNRILYDKYCTTGMPLWISYYGKDKDLCLSNFTGTLSSNITYFDLKNKKFPYYEADETKLDEALAEMEKDVIVISEEDKQLLEKLGIRLELEKRRDGNLLHLDATNSSYVFRHDFHPDIEPDDESETVYLYENIYYGRSGDEFRPSVDEIRLAEEENGIYRIDRFYQGDQCGSDYLFIPEEEPVDNPAAKTDLQLQDV